MLLIHTIESALRSGRHARLTGVRGWLSSCTFSDGGHYRSGPHSVRPSVD